MNNEIDEERQEQVTEDKLAALDYIFNSTPASDDDEFNLTKNLPFDVNKPSADEPDDDLEKTLEIDNVQLEELKKIRESLVNADSIADGGISHGKVLTKRKPGTPNFREDNQGDVGQILTSFIACVQLAGITALMGAAWLVNLIIHIR